MQDDLIQIQNLIFILRGSKVMLDSDLAKLYGVDTKRLNEQVKRNIERFPNDFMFECNFEDLDDLRSQIATANRLSDWNHKRRNMPMVFTENGVAMLSSVLNSKKAIQVNIAIMRIFNRLRSFHLLEDKIDRKVYEFENNQAKAFNIVFERLDNIEEEVFNKKRKVKIGFK